MAEISLEYVQKNRHNLALSCKYRLWMHSVKNNRTIKHLIKSESYEHMEDVVKNITKENKENSDIIDTMKDRCNSKLLYHFLKKQNVDYFVPLQKPSYEILQGNNDIVIEICYYHNTDVYDIMYNNAWYHKKGYIMAPQGEIRKKMANLYYLYRMDPPFENNTAR